MPVMTTEGVMGLYALRVQSRTKGTEHANARVTVAMGVTFLAVAVVLLSRCASSDSSSAQGKKPTKGQFTITTIAAGVTSAEALPTVAGALPTVAPGGFIPTGALATTKAPRRGLPTPQAAGRDLLESWRDNDRVRALGYATQAAVDTLFAQPWGAEISDNGCISTANPKEFRCIFLRDRKAWVAVITGDSANGFRTQEVIVISRSGTPTTLAIAGIDPGSGSGSGSGGGTTIAGDVATGTDVAGETIPYDPNVEGSMAPPDPASPGLSPDGSPIDGVPIDGVPIVEGTKKPGTKTAVGGSSDQVVSDSVPGTPIPGARQPSAGQSGSGRPKKQQRPKSTAPPSAKKAKIKKKPTAPGAPAAPSPAPEPASGGGAGGGDSGGAVTPAQPPVQSVDG
jgi:hypothetical protein